MMRRRLCCAHEGEASRCSPAVLLLLLLRWTAALGLLRVLVLPMQGLRAVIAQVLKRMLEKGRMVGAILLSCSACCRLTAAATSARLVRSARSLPRARHCSSLKL